MTTSRLAIYIIASVIILFLINLFIWLVRKEPKSKLYNRFESFLTQAIAITSIILAIASFHTSNKISKDQIIPKLQTKPVSLEEKIYTTIMKIYVRNNSEYTAKNVFVDVKFGNHNWKEELRKAERKDTEIELFTENEMLNRMLEDLNNLPALGELKPGQAMYWHMSDPNKEFWLKQKMFFRYPDGREVPIPPTETRDYRNSQGWHEDLKIICDGQPMKVKIRARWENEIGRKFDRLSEYQLECTKIGTGRSFTFLFTGEAIEDI
jgi:hypothetical protein